jgi:aldehyde:ferredoxin oxidoreductase
MELNLFCNRAGLDTISAGACVAFAMECYENGLFSEMQLEGLKLEWGDGKAALTLLERIVERRGLGDLLADGVWRASQEIGKGSEAYAIHAGGQELPAHDPRHEPDFGLVYQVSPTPGRHTQGGVGAVNMPPEEMALLGLDPNLKEKDPLAFHAQAYATVMAWTNVVNAAGLCTFGGFTLGREHAPDFIAAVTGWEFDMAECVQAGERIEVMRLLFGLNQDYNPLRTQVAPRAMGHPPQTEGPTAGKVVDVDDLRETYLKFMDWDQETARPSDARLAKLGMSELTKGEAA